MDLAGPPVLYKKWLTDDLPSFHSTLADFLSVYDAKANVELKSARVWPPEKTSSAWRKSSLFSS